MVNVHLNLSIFTVFLKNKNIIFKIRRSKVTDYAALNAVYIFNKKTNFHGVLYAVFKYF